MTGATRGADTSRGAGAVAAGRDIDGRLARVHLRTGSLGLARAELEIMAGTGRLDREALADLAEARWRTGDLPGAARAAQAHLEQGGREPVAYVVAAEALLATGQPRDAREMADRLLVGMAAGSSVLEPILAGQPHSDLWPAFPEVAPVSPAAAERPVAAPAPLAGRAAAARAGRPVSPLPSPTPSVPVPADATQGGRTLDTVEAAIAGGDLEGVPIRLALLLREGRGQAPLVLSLADRALTPGAAGPPAAELRAALHLVRGDAYRLLGRDLEASAAVQAARLALEGPAISEEDA